MSNKYKTHKNIIHEFIRYLLIGGAAFIIDFAILYLTKTFILYDLEQTGILIAAALGFTAGLIFNFIFSFNYVFKENTEKAKQNKSRSFILFAAIGITGLLITEVFMYTGINLFEEKWYLIIKCFTAGIVLLWNYIARKLFIFKGAGYARE